MYNRYMYGSFAPVLQSPSAGKKSTVSKPSATKHTKTGLQDSLSTLLGGLNLQKLITRFDAGDILLTLIILFLCYEGDNLELVITLGLILLLGLEEPQSTP